MCRSKPVIFDDARISDVALDGHDNLVLIDDVGFVAAFAEAGRSLGKKLVCVRCFDPSRTLRAVMVLLDAWNAADETAGSVGLCCDCYRDLAELMFRDAVIRASKITEP